MSEALLDHLWQSTLFACGAALLTYAPGSPRACAARAPTDPDLRNSRIRLFELRVRYAT
jgi:hypothetical protein